MDVGEEWTEEDEEEARRIQAEMDAIEEEFNRPLESTEPIAGNDLLIIFRALGRLAVTQNERAAVSGLMQLTPEDVRKMLRFDFSKWLSDRERELDTLIARVMLELMNEVRDIAEDMANKYDGS